MCQGSEGRRTRPDFSCKTELHLQIEFNFGLTSLNDQQTTVDPTVGSTTVSIFMAQAPGRQGLPKA